MNKPTTQKREYLDYNECTDWIEEKYGIQTRDYLGKFAKSRSHFGAWAEKRGYTFPLTDAQALEYQIVEDGAKADLRYLDFWHWIIDRQEVHNGCFIFLERIDGELDEDGEGEEEWVRDIIKLYFAEFAEEGQDDLEFYVSW